MDLHDRVDAAGFTAEVRRVRTEVIKALAVPGSHNMMVDAAAIALTDVLVMVMLAGVSTNRAKVRDALSVMLDVALDHLASDASLAKLKESREKFPGLSDAEQLELARKMGLVK